MPLIQRFARHVPPGLLVFASVLALVAATIVLWGRPLSLLVFAALLALVVAPIFLWGRSRASTAAASTNSILFAIVILLFAVVLKLVSSGMDVVVFFVALVGLGIGCYGISSAPH